LEPDNYRGISLLPVLGKIYSGIITHSLRDWVMHRKKLTLFQMKFTKGRRTIDTIKTYVDKYLTAKKR
jgi:hypothetical protein